MAKVDIGKLKKMLKKQPELETTLAVGLKGIVCNYSSLGEYASIMIVGTEESTPEILMQKSELRKFAQEILAKVEAK